MFADFDEEARAERWHDLVVRPIEALDASAVAAVFAERENVGLEQALETVSRWIDPDPGRLTLVAERRGLVHGYGKAEQLRPGEQGGNAPTGWYLTGLVVAPTARRRGLGARLTEERIASLAERTSEVWYFANARNRATIALHERHGFVLQTYNFTIPGVTLEGGPGALFRLRIEQG